MRQFIAAAALGLSLLSAVVTAATPPAGTDMAKIASHLKEHQKYPATRQQLLDACAELKDFSDAEKKWFSATLPDRTYKSADDVVNALKAAK